MFTLSEKCLVLTVRFGVTIEFMVLLIVGVRLVIGLTRHSVMCWSH